VSYQWLLRRHRTIEMLRKCLLCLSARPPPPSQPPPPPSPLPAPPPLSHSPARLSKKLHLITLAVAIALLLMTTRPAWMVEWNSRVHNPVATNDTVSVAQCTMRTIADSRTASTELRSWATFERDDCEVDELAALWEDLTELFQANPPVPARIMRPIMGRPAETLLETYTADMADADLPMDAIEAWATRRAHESVVDALPPYRPISHTFHGQGIVILAGARYAGYAATSIGVLRQLGSELPIELWAKDEIEEDQLWCEELVLQGVACKRISDYAILGSRWDWVNPSAWLSKPLPWSPYQWKVMTILFSSFEEVLFLDADSIPVLDPAFLFDSDVYRENGVVLWPDRWPSIASRWLPYLVGLTDTKSDAMWYQQTVESGQMLWNKRTHWKVCSHATKLVHQSTDSSPNLAELAPCLLL